MELHSCFQYSNPNVQKDPEKIYFFKDSEGVQHFPVGGGVQLLPGGGVQILISIEPHITCDFL